MAYVQDIGFTDDDAFYIGDDKVLSFRVWSGTAAEIEAGTATPMDVTGQSFAWALKRNADLEEELIQKATGGEGITITGAYNADRALNTQRVEVQIDRADTYDDDTPAVVVRRGRYVHALRRTDTGFSGIVTEGKFKVRSAAAE